MWLPFLNWLVLITAQKGSRRLISAVVDRVPVESKTACSIGYEDATLEIEFTNGSVYRCFDVPERVHEELMVAGSHGKFFNQRIRGTYPYTRS
ncbi:MAG TPA: KTSC domain-containing protein [Solirubrobacteraceae bacterium]|nr:KTSC domain-containing protein [Solirubrobacteraceae bacterium]